MKVAQVAVEGVPTNYLMDSIYGWIDYLKARLRDITSTIGPNSPSIKATLVPDTISRMLNDLSNTHSHNNKRFCISKFYKTILTIFFECPRFWVAVAAAACYLKVWRSY